MRAFAAFPAARLRGKRDLALFFKGNLTDLPIDQQTLLEAVAQAMAMRSAEHRAEYEQELAALREKIAKLEGQIDVLMSLMQGKGQIIDLPSLPARNHHVA
jgi:hypothetical protein